MTIAVYAGTFDPLTEGHVSVIRQAARLFSHVRVLVAVHPTKEPLFTAQERVEMIREALAIMPTVSVAWTAELVVEHARAIAATHLVRGLRNAADAGWETELAKQNREIAPDIATIMLPAEPHLASVSSSELKARWSRGEDIGPWCPPAIAARLEARAASDAAVRS
ncbi:MAG: pantetheine-phosphate adenylyltransferase [Myxococcota bacterium]|nr:pantetheine-phosphate adenylyltransferase [Myxococcota bacterium]